MCVCVFEVRLTRPAGRALAVELADAVRADRAVAARIRRALVQICVCVRVRDRVQVRRA